ncbi:MAG: hypothetical protein K2H93_01300 [Oscillospiraceae bacterium]|nr:hypothetical protein [Oscillospiraceae bacterium]
MELKLKNCRIIIDFGFPAMLALVFLQSENVIMRKILLVCLLHELGHGFVMCLTGAGVREIKLHASGMQMLTNTCLLSTGQSFCIYFSGPVVNLLFAILFWNINSETAMLHASMGIFNLLPYKILDGGAMLHCVLENKSELLQILNIVCVLLSIAVISAGYYYHVKNPVIYLMAVYLAVSEFMIDKS